MNGLFPWYPYESWRDGLDMEMALMELAFFEHEGPVGERAQLEKGVAASLLKPRKYHA